MAITFVDGDLDDAILADINTTPLVDVMLVLLIIFLITVPVLSTSVVVNLPRHAHQLQASEAQPVVISVDAQGRTYWLDSRVPDTASLRAHLNAAAARQPQPAVHIRGDASADYAAVAQVLQAAQAAGLARVGFITEPAGSR